MDTNQGAFSNKEFVTGFFPFIRRREAGVKN